MGLGTTGPIGRPTPEHLAHISSLYGPGTVGCWIFTVASCFLSWSRVRDRGLRRTNTGILARNPKVVAASELRRPSNDSLDADFVASLLLPAVASAHLIAQLRRYDAEGKLVIGAGGRMEGMPPAASVNINGGDASSAEALITFLAELDATGRVAETGCVVSSLLLAFAFVDLRWKRLCLALPVTLLSFVATWSLAFKLKDWYPLTGPIRAQDYVFNPGWDALNFFFVLSFMLAYGVTFAVMIALNVGNINSTVGSRGGRTVMSYFALSVPMTSYMLARHTPFIFDHPEPSRMDRLKIVLRSFAYPVPRTNYNLYDLDQAVAFCGGCIIFILAVSHTKIITEWNGPAKRTIFRLRELAVNRINSRRNLRTSG